MVLQGAWILASWSWKVTETLSGEFLDACVPYVPEEDSTDGRSTLARPPVHDIPFHPSYFDGSLLLVENMSNAAAVRSVDDEWIAPLRNGMFAAVEWYSHGFSPKYRAVMETGHVVAVRFLPALVGVHAVV